MLLLKMFTAEIAANLNPTLTIEIQSLEQLG